MNKQLDSTILLFFIQLLRYTTGYRRFMLSNQSCINRSFVKLKCPKCNANNQWILHTTIKFSEYECLKCGFKRRSRN